MQIKTIGIVSPGDMGQAVAIRLKECGFEVLAALEGRSARGKTHRQSGSIDPREQRTLTAVQKIISP